MLKLGIIGRNFVVDWMLAAAEQVPDLQPVAIYSRSMDDAKAFAEKYHLTYTFDDLEAMANCPEVDAVYVASPNFCHYPQCKLLLEHGKHVLCEKAMVLTAADAEEVFRLAREKNLFCMEAMWSRFLPQYQRAKQWIEEGRIGSIQSANVVVGFKATVDPGHRLINPDLAGGAMYDIGVYAIEPLAYLVGEPIEDCLGVWRKHPVTGVDERATVILQFHSCDAAIQCMFTANPKEYVIINGTEGIIELPFVSGGHDAYLYDVRRNLVEHFRDEWPHSFQFELEEVIRCIREGRITSEIMPPEATIQCARVYDKILRG